MVVVILDRQWLYTTEILCFPNVQPFTKGHFTGCDISTGGDRGCCRLKLLTDFLLCLAIDGLLGLFARLRVNAGGIAGLPAPVGALADGAAALCVLGIAFHMYLSFL